MQADKPNIILLTIDTLRPDRLGCYGYEKNLTPNLDRLAQDGVRFTQAITGGSWTQAAFPVIITSSYASMYGGCLGPLAAERPSPIALLKQNGYRTAGFSTSPLLSRTYRYDRDFDYFIDLDPGESDPKLRHIKGGQRLLRTSLTHHVARLLGQQTRPAKLYATAADLTAAARQWIEAAPHPFFAWAHYMDVHWPYHLEENLTRPAEIARAWRDLGHLHGVNWHGEEMTPAQRDHYIRLYEEALAYTDAQIGRLFDYLERSGLAENTVIIAVSDHGEEFMEHGRWGHWENNLYDEILRVPLLIRLPGEPETAVVKRQVRTLDLMPTILELAGCDHLPRMAGTSLAPLWGGQAETYTPPVSISEMWRDEWHIIAVRTEDFKYIWDSKRPDDPQLFDLQADPGEQDNVAAAYPAIVSRLHRHVARRLTEMEQTRPAEATAEPTLDGEMLDRLRGLGYVE